MSLKRNAVLPYLLAVMVVCAGAALGAGLVGDLSGKEAAATETMVPVTVSEASDNATVAEYGPVAAPVAGGASLKYMLTGGMSISGRVSGPDGRGIAGVPVIVRPASPGAGAVPAPVETGADGSYSVVLDSPGYFKLLFTGGEAGAGFWTSAWYGGGSSEVDAEAVPAGATGVDAVLEPTGELAGRVSFPSRPFPLQVIAYRADVRESEGEAGTDPITNQPDTFSSESLPPGDYKLLFVPDDRRGQPSEELGPFWYGGTNWDSALPVHIGAGQTTRLEVSLPKRSESVVFGTLSYDREAYPFARVALVESGDQQRVVASDDSPADSTFRHGFSYFQINGVPTGEYKLRCELPGGRMIWYLEGLAEGTDDFSRASVIKMAAEKAVGKLSFGAMSFPAQASGRLQGADGAPLANRRVYALRTDERGERIVSSFYPITDDSGIFSGSLSPGTYRLCTVDWQALKRYCRESFEVQQGQRAVGATLTLPAP